MDHKFRDKLKTTLPASYHTNNSNNNHLDKGVNLRRSNSVGRFFEKFRTKIFGKPLSITLEGETPSELTLPELNNGKNHTGDCTALGANMEKQDGRRTSAFKCHLCNFCADRITILDRHLLNEHKIGLENLLKLVMAKTKTKDNRADSQNGGRAPYYQHSDNSEDTDAASVFDRIRSLSPSTRKEYRTVGTNTVSWTSGISLKKSCDEVNEQLEKFLSLPMDKFDPSTLLAKMSCITEVMSNIIESSNAMHLDTSSIHGLSNPKHGLSTSPRVRRTGSIRGFDTSPNRGWDDSMKRYTNTGSIYGIEGPNRTSGNSPNRGYKCNARFDTGPINLLASKNIPSVGMGDVTREFNDF